MNSLSLSRLRRLLRSASQARLLVVGDVMLDQFIWGTVRRISPEAPVPVVDFDRESSMPGGAGNVARNLTGLRAQCDLAAVVGRDDHARTLQRLLRDDRVGCDGLIGDRQRCTTVKTRIIAHQQ